MSLSVCLLTRNEENTVSQAVRSVLDVATEVLVVDTHSRDQTAARAADAGARVLQYEWADDFAAGRNFTIRQATSDWVLWLNGTETVTPESLPHLCTAVEQPKVFGYFVRIRTPLSATRPEQQAETMDLRLFRRRPDLHFVGRAHPHFEASFAEIVRRGGYEVRPAAITLQGAPFAEQTESKLRFAAKLMELELQDRPGQLHYMIELALTLLQLKDPKAPTLMAEAAQQVFAQREAKTAPNVKVQALLAYVLTTAEGTTCISRELVRNLSLRWFPASPRLMHIIAEDAYQRRDFRLAANLLERLLTLGSTGQLDRSHAFDPELLGDRVRVNLGACYYNLGEAIKAEQCYQPLLANEKYRAVALEGIAAAHRMQRQGGRFSFDIGDVQTQ
jgi:hypothetical protein